MRSDLIEFVPLTRSIERQRDEWKMVELVRSFEMDASIDHTPNLYVEFLARSLRNRMDGIRYRLRRIGRALQPARQVSYSSHLGIAVAFSLTKTLYIFHCSRCRHEIKGFCKQDVGRDFVFHLEGCMNFFAMKPEDVFRAIMQSKPN